MCVFRKSIHSNFKVKPKVVNNCILNFFFLFFFFSDTYTNKNSRSVNEENYFKEVVNILCGGGKKMLSCDSDHVPPFH